jgi:quinol monooxygenase YgiN
MLIVHVHIQVKPQFIEEFIRATNENAKKSRNEPGIARFDFIQQIDDPSRFILVEVYRTPEDSMKHKETEHYRKWRDTVKDMMASPRESLKYTNISPSDLGW